MLHKAKKPNNMRLCSEFVGTAKPHRAPIDSRMVHIATQNRSTEPKNSGARVNAVIVAQSCTDLNVGTGNIKCSRRFIATRLVGSVRTYHLVLTAVFTLVTAFAVLDTVVDVLLISVSSL
jgi:hypothetical protein